MIRFLTIIALSLLLRTPAGAGYDEGLKAHERGDYAAALKEWEPLAEEGNANAQYSLGFLYENAQGVQKDAENAINWYQIAAERGHVKAQSALGFMYDEGKDVPRNYVEAYKWYDLATTNGDEPARKSRAILGKK